MIKVLIISKRYPMKDNKAVGNYIYSRITAFEKLDNNIDITMGVPVPIYGPILRLVKKLSGDTTKQVEFEPITTDTRTIEIPYKLRVLDYKRGKEAKRLEKALKRIVKDYDLVHGHFLWEEGIAAYNATKNTGVKCVITSHGVGVDKHMSSKKYGSMILEAVNGCDKVCFVGTELQNTAARKGYRNTGKVIFDGVDLDKFYTGKSKLRRNYADDDTVIIGFVGNYVLAKGADRLASIADKIYSKNKNVKFVFLGDGRLRQSVTSDMQSKNIPCAISGNVPFDTMPEQFRAMDVLIAPSRREAFGCAVLEARACGVLVVAPKLGGFVHSVGDGGILVDTDNIEENIASAVLNALESKIDRDYIADTAKDLTWERTVKLESDVYNEVMYEE